MYKIESLIKSYYLCVLLICSIDNGGTTHFWNLWSVPKKRPAADLIAAYHILNKEDPPVEPQG